MIDVLATAINARYDSASGAALRALTTGMYPEEAPQGAIGIYITYSFIITDSEWTFDTTFDGPLVQFSLWSSDDSPLSVMEAGTALVSLYKDVLLTVTGWTSVRADKVGERLLDDPNDKGFQYIVEMKYKLGT